MPRFNGGVTGQLTQFCGELSDLGVQNTKGFVKKLGRKMQVFRGGT